MTRSARHRWRPALVNRLVLVHAGAEQIQALAARNEKIPGWPGPNHRRPTAPTATGRADRNLVRDGRRGDRRCFRGSCGRSASAGENDRPTFFLIPPAKSSQVTSHRIVLCPPPHCPPPHPSCRAREREERRDQALLLRRRWFGLSPLRPLPV